MRGCHGSQLQSYFNKFIWRECHGTLPLLTLQNIMRDIAVQYLAIVHCMITTDTTHIDTIILFSALCNQTIKFIL